MDGVVAIPNTKDTIQTAPTILFILLIR